MVRSAYPNYLADASRQRQNMGLPLDVALTRLEEVCRQMFDVRMEELIFPEKIWLINHTNLLSRFMTWGEEDGVTMINLDEFESELLANESTVHLFKTGKLVSFIRQFNLYDFKKKSDVFVDVDGKGNQLRFGLYSHAFVRKDRKELLKECTRKVVKRVGVIGNRKRLDIDSDSEDFTIQTKKRRVPRGTSRKAIEGSTSTGSTQSSDIEALLEASCEPPSPGEQVRNMIKTMPRELPIQKLLPWPDPPLPPQNFCITHTFPSTSMRLRSSPAQPVAPPKENVPLNKEQMEQQRTLMMKRWMEMPVDWRLFPTTGEKAFADAWMGEYDWMLDPFVVGELAALAQYDTDHMNPIVTDEELTQWVQELDAANQAETSMPFSLNA